MFIKKLVTLLWTELSRDLGQNPRFLLNGYNDDRDKTERIEWLELLDILSVNHELPTDGLGKTNSYRLKVKRVRIGSACMGVFPPSRPRRLSGTAVSEIYEPAATLVPSNRYTRPGPAVFDNNFHLVPPRDIRASTIPGEPARGPVTDSNVPDIFRRGTTKFFWNAPRSPNNILSLKRDAATFPGLCTELFKRLHRSRIGTRRPFAVLPWISLYAAVLRAFQRFMAVKKIAARVRTICSR